MKNVGFTLIELIVVLALAALILAFGVPGFQNTLRTNRLVTQTNQFVGALNLARSEAIKRGVRVTLCRSADGQSCAGSGGYDQGWIVFTEDPDNPDGNGTFDRDAEELIQVANALPAGIGITGNRNVAASISYTPRGSTVELGTISACPESGSGRAIVISLAGRMRVVKKEDCS